jgi:glycosyltransferase involved in cell wall biosynthesis
MGSPVSVSDDRELLALSGLLDDARYRARAGLPDGADAITHYLEQGWRQGLDPSDDFAGDFLCPYYDAAGLHGPPALTWLELSVMPGRRAPMNRAEAEGLADRIRASRFLDAATYARRLPGALDPAMHYAVVGEALGWCPSADFDPAFYLESYPDVADSGLSPLAHYLDSGQHEGRRAIPAASRLAFPPLPDRTRPTVVLVLHDASRTGAPVLGWNIARRLAGSYNVVSLLLRGGDLEANFAAVSAATVGPMVWQEYRPAEIARVAERLVAAYDPLFAIANSVETHLLVPALARLGVPSVALVHEFAAYTRPLAKMQDVLDWATHVVFPANLVADSAYAAFPAFANRRGVHVASPGRSELPKNPVADTGHGRISRSVWPDDAAGRFVVLGLGSVQFRKGVDLFLGTAAQARRLAPELDFRFVWIGDGYDPVGDNVYSTYLAEQIARSDLAGTVAIRDAVEDLEAVYAGADMLFLSSRLDPQPNVGIDAVTRGLPTVCFDGASGTAEILSADPQTRPLVVPHLDVHAAAEAICRLARDRAAMAAMRTATARVGAAAYDMAAYVRQVDGWGRAAAAALRAEDLQTLVDSRAVDAELALPPGVLAPGAFGVERQVLQQWAVVGTSPDQTANPQFRRPCAGFHPQAYARAHPEACGEGGANPLAHWLRAGRPDGGWSRRVFSPLDPPPRAATPLRVALHAHVSDTLARDLAARLAGNATRCDLFLSAATQAMAAQLRPAFAGHAGAVTIRVLDRGHDIDGFLAGFASEIESGDHDLFGHVAGGQDLDPDAASNELGRAFLWENLIGGQYPMLDLAAAAFAARPDLGLLMAEEPRLAGWGKNRAIAQALAVRLGLAATLDDFIDFPLGGMVWARPAALRPLLALGLASPDLAADSVADDGSLPQALERLLPTAARRAGLAVAGLRAPGTTW